MWPSLCGSPESSGVSAAGLSTPRACGHPSVDPLHYLQAYSSEAGATVLLKLLKTSTQPIEVEQHCRRSEFQREHNGSLDSSKHSSQSRVNIWTSDNFRPDRSMPVKREPSATASGFGRHGRAARMAPQISASLASHKTTHSCRPSTSK